VRPYNAETMNDWIDWAKATDFLVVDVPFLTNENKELAEKANLAIGTFDVNDVAALLSKDESKRNNAVVSVCNQLKEAAALGGQTCFMCLVPEDPKTTRAESFQFFKETFPEITTVAEKYGIKIVFEGWPGPDPYLPTLGCTPETLRAMFTAVPSPSLCVNYDPSHLYRLGIDYIRFLREFMGRIAHVHGKDCKFTSEDVYLYGQFQSAAFGQPVKFSSGPWRYTIPGEGDINWAEIAFELERGGYKGPVCIELEDHRYSNSVEEQRNGFQKAGAFLSQYFQ